MAFVQGISEIIDDLEQVGKKVARDGWQIPKKISDSWVFMIHITDAIDKGNMLRAIAWHPQETSAELQQSVIDTSDNEEVTYEGFVEGGTKYMAARFPAQKAIEREDFVQNIFDFVESSLVNSK